MSKLLASSSLADEQDPKPERLCDLEGLEHEVIQVGCTEAMPRMPRIDGHAG
jgi:hypothetical protein